MPFENPSEVAGKSLGAKLSEALSKSPAERGKVDIEKMQEESRQEALKKLKEIRGE